MSIPQPQGQLEGHCSAINDDTLYVLSPNSFLSLPLKAHAQWAKEKIGVPVTGAACVKVGDGSDAFLYVVGGTTDGHDYSGLQRYSFSNKSWETLSTAAPVLQGRTDHSVAYLEDSRQILVYAGSQRNAPSYLSSQTFVISTQSPFGIQSYISMAPPTHLPILQPFNTSHAVMAGGSDLNTQIYTFGPTDGWQPLPTEMTAPLDPNCRGTVIDGSDGSKVLEVYDMSVSPNNVTQVVLLGPYGQPAYTGQTIGPNSSSRKRKRDLSLNSWPAYNDTNAPTATRSDCSVAQGFRVAVIAGGSSDAPVAIFNQYENSWIDADKFFDSKQQQQPLKPSKSSGGSRTTASSTSSSSASSTVASITGDQAAHDRMLRTLGITLGVLCGIAAIFILVLLYLRWRKMKKRKAEGYLDEKTNDNARMSFQDRGASFMKEAGGSVNGLQPPPNKAWNDSQNGSHSSLAIITGKFSNKRGTNGHEPKASYDSTARLVKDKNGTAIASEPVELVDLDEKKMAEQRRPSMIARTEPKPPAAHYGPTLTAQDARISQDAKDRRKRSSGWSKYFATSQPNDLSHLPTAYTKHSTLGSDASVYSNDRIPSQPSQIPSSALVPPLDIDFSKSVDGQRLSHVATGSPSFNDSREDLPRGSLAHEGQRGLIVDPNRPRSQSETISSYNRSTMSSTMTGEYYNESGMTPWTPTSATFKDHLISRPTSDSRPPSSVYETNRLPSRGKGSGFFPGAGTSYRPSPKSKMGHSASPSSDWASPPPPKTSSVGAGGLKVQKPAEGRDSTLTVFPRGVPSAYYADGREREQDPAKPVNSDLAWLNLGLNGSQSRL